MQVTYCKSANEVEHKLVDHPIYNKIDYREGDSSVLGYYIDLESNFDLTEDYFIRNSLKGHYLNLQSLNSPFLVLLKKGKSITALSDKNGMFNFYYGVEGDYVYFDIFIDNLVKNFSKLSIKKSNLLWFLTLFDTNYNNQTIYKEINKLQPGYVTTIDADSGVSVKAPKFDFDDASYNFKNIGDVGECFYNDLANLFSTYNSKIGEKKFSFDLSSGLDSSLLSFFGDSLLKNSSFRTVFDFSQEKLPENRQVIEDFVVKHNLQDRHGFIDIPTTYNLNDTEFFDVEYYPYNIMAYEAYKDNLSVKKSGSQVHVTGFGGNQVFGSGSTTDYYNNYTYNNYYKLVRYANSSGIFHYLSNRSKHLYLNKDIYRSLDYNYSYLEDTALNSLEATFNYHFNNGVLNLSPLTDYRIVSRYQNLGRFSFLQGIPVTQVRREVLRGLEGRIYLPEQFEEENRQDYRSSKLQYYYENIEILKDLADKGFYSDLGILSTDGFKLLSNPDLMEHRSLDPELCLFFVHLVRFESYYKKVSKNTKLIFVDE